MAGPTLQPSYELSHTDISLEEEMEERGRGGELLTKTLSDQC